MNGKKKKGKKNQTILNFNLISLDFDGGYFPQIWYDFFFSFWFSSDVENKMFKLNLYTSLKNPLKNYIIESMTYS